MSHDFPMIFPCFPMVYWELISARDVTPLVIHHSHLSEDTLGQLPFVNGLALNKFSHAQLLRLFWEVGPSQKKNKAFFFWCEENKKNCISAPA